MPLTPDQVKADRHAWMIDHATGAILHDEIAKRALEKVKAEIAEAEAVVANPKLHEAHKKHYRALIAQGVEVRAQRQTEIMTDSAERIAWDWLGAHGLKRDGREMSESEMKGLSSDHWVSP
jgi:hemerythrin